MANLWVPHKEMFIKFSDWSECNTSLNLSRVKTEPVRGSACGLW
jgi:hypothetical protein